MRIETKFVIAILIFVSITANIVSAATVELISPSQLPHQLREGQQMDIEIKIKDYDYDDAKSITIESNLVPSGDDSKPLYDFGELNQYINENRYQQKIILNLTSIPQKAFFYVKISGKVPDGETRIGVERSNIVITKFRDSKLKFFEVKIDEKLATVESFELIIKKKDIFEESLKKVEWNELDNLKKETRKLFESGLVTEAQNIVNELNNVKRPDNLFLFGIIGIDSSLLLSIAVIAALIIGIVIGLLLGRPEQEDNNDEYKYNN